MNMSMHSVSKCSNGSATFVLWRPGTKWGLKCNISVMVLCTLMVLTIENGYVATAARKDTIWSVSPLRNLKQSNGLSYAPSMPVGNRLDLKRVAALSKRVIKRVTFSFSVPKQKTTTKKIRRGTDGRRIPVRKAASAGKGKKEQGWKEKDIDEMFRLWARNDELQPEQKLSISKIAKQCGVPYTTSCERLKGRRGGGKCGKITGGRRMSRALSAGESG